MNTTKAHIAALSLLDRALIAISDDEMKALLAGLPADHVSAIKRISGLRPNDGSELEAPAASAVAASDDADAESDGESTAAVSTLTAADIDDETIEAIRTAAHKGRLNGDLQRLGVVMSDACLAECVTLLGDQADMPSETDLTGVMPTLIEHHGVGAVRLMLASTVVGEAPASAIIVGMLKNDELVKLPVLEQKPLAPLLPLKEADADRIALKAQRKDRKVAEQAAAKLRREQQLKAKNRL
ncbi:MAG: hypothetical protein ABIR32_11935 [Ilumatobacteraceae bacterium]